MKFSTNGDSEEPPPVVRDGERTELDEAQRQKIEEFIRTAKPAISGQGDSNPTLWVAVALSWEWALCRKLTIEFMRLYSATRCKPPWSEDEIERKVDSAFERRHKHAFGRRWLPWFRRPHTTTNQASAYGILLDAAIDTAVKFSDNSATGSIARSGSFRGAALIVSAGTDAVALKDKLRDLGIFVEGSIPVPA